MSEHHFLPCSTVQWNSVMTSFGLIKFGCFEWGVLCWSLTLVLVLPFTELLLLWQMTRACLSGGYLICVFLSPQLLRLEPTTFQFLDQGSQYWARGIFFVSFRLRPGSPWQGEASHHLRYCSQVKKAETRNSISGLTQLHKQSCLSYWEILIFLKNMILSKCVFFLKMWGDFSPFLPCIQMKVANLSFEGPVQGVLAFLAPESSSGRSGWCWMLGQRKASTTEMKSSQF